MSVNKQYENATLFLTPVDQTLKSELFFKMFYEFKGGNWVPRVSADETRANFFTGTGAGWIDANAVTNIGSIQDFRIHMLTNNVEDVPGVAPAAIRIRGLSADQQKAIRDRVIALRKDGSKTSLAWLNLFDTRFVFTTAAGAAINAARTDAMADTVVVTQRAPIASLYAALVDKAGAGIVGLPVINTAAAPVPAPAAAIGAADVWAWNIGTYYARKAAAAPGAPGTDAWAALIAGPSGPKYEDLLERGADNEFLVKQADGTTKPLDQVVKGTSVCAQSGQTPGAGGDAACQANIMQCTLTLGDNTDGSAKALANDACVVALGAANVWKIGKDDIKALNPVMVFKLVRNLGFKGVQDKTTKLIKVEDYASWKNKVDNNKLTKDDGSADLIDTAGPAPSKHDNAKALADKAEFKNYAIALIGYINSNPAILNGNNAAPKKKDAFGVEAALGNEKLESLTSLVNQARDSMITVHGAVSAYGLPGITPTNPMALLGLGMLGGNQDGGFLSTTVSTRKVEIPKFTDKLKDVYQHYVNRLSTMNKELSPATKTAVEAVFDSLGEKEKQLALWVDYLHKYSEVMRIEQNTDHDKLVGETQLKEAYEKYEKTLAKYHKRSVNMIDILATLYTATEDNKKKAAGVPLTM